MKGSIHTITRAAFSFTLLAVLSLSVPLQTLAQEKAPAGKEKDGIKLGLGANQIIKKMEAQMRADTNYSEMTMEVHNPNWDRPRSYSMRAWEDRKEEKSFIRITAPPRDKGKAFLKEGNVFKVYIPTERENKPITIPPSLMLQPWMGSDFTYDDMVKESSIIEDYEQTIEKVEKTDKGKLVQVRLDPRPEAPVVWGMLRIWVNLDNMLPTKWEYYDEEGVKTRVMKLSEVEEMDGRKVPTRWEMTSLDEDKEGNKTVLMIEEMKFNLEIPEDTFTEKNLTRRDWE